MRLGGCKFVKLPKFESLKELNLFLSLLLLWSLGHTGGLVRLLDSFAILDSVTNLSKSSSFFLFFLFLLVFEEGIELFLGALLAALDALVYLLRRSKGSFLFLDLSRIEEVL